MTEHDELRPSVQESLQRVSELLRRHEPAEGFAHGVGDFQQNFPVAVGLDQIPHHQPLNERKGFKNVGDIGRMQWIQQNPQIFQYFLALRGIFRRGVRLARRIHRRLHKRIMPVEQVGYALKRVVNVGAGVAIRFHSGALRDYPPWGAASCVRFYGYAVVLSKIFCCCSCPTWQRARDTIAARTRSAHSR